MAGADLAGVNQRLRGVEGGLQDLGVHVGGHVAKLSKRLGQRGAAQAAVALAEVHQQQLAGAGELEVGGHGLGDVLCHGVCGDHNVSGGHDTLAVASSRHGEGVLAAVDGDLKVDHAVTQSHSGVPHVHALGLHLGSMHPVDRGFNVAQGGDLCPHQVSERLTHRQAGHGGMVDEALDGLLADGGGQAAQAAVGLGHDGAVGDGEKHGAHALLLCHEASDRAVHLGGQEALAAHRRLLEDILQGICNREARQIEWAEVLGGAGELVGLLGHVTQDGLQVQVHSGGLVGGLAVLHHDAAGVCDGADHLEVAALAVADLLQEVTVLGAQQKAVVLLVLSTPDLEHRHGLVAELHVAHVDLAAVGVHNLLHHVAVAASALIVE
mmetsp:Transcript_1465/g.4241  ORF Transcript_1465/g.4241 Transcript_1465/m.4241 type:complete len:380 (+) Transcript_1465:934-2073(+)